MPLAPLTFMLGMNNKVSELEARFRHLGIVSGKTLLLPETAAIEFIEALRGIGAPVLGVDSFEIKSGNICPLLDHILDLSSGCKDTWSEATAFIKQRREAELHFEVVA